ncbi:MAG: CehA/McbA family metallohydrolase [Kiritimatiellia bacterium]
MSVHLESPYEQAGELWLRGNLHTHTKRSDGSVSPQAMVMVYAAHGYDFLAVSDHDQPPVAEKAVDDCGMILLPAVEVTADDRHVLNIGAKELLPAKKGLQPLLDEILTGGGFSVLCHPSWGENFSHYSWEQLATLKNYAGIEIYNGLSIDHPGSHLAVDKWDRLLSLGRRVLGFANDDAHTPEDVARGWIMALVVERTPAALLAALRRGSFYASSGLTIERIICEGQKLIVNAPDAQALAVFGRHGTRICQVPGPELRLDATHFAGPYLRVECYGASGAMAWTQPIYVHRHKPEKQVCRI